MVHKNSSVCNFYFRQLSRAIGVTRTVYIVSWQVPVCIERLCQVVYTARFPAASRWTWFHLSEFSVLTAPRVFFIGVGTDHRIVLYTPFTGGIDLSKKAGGMGILVF